MAYPRLGLYEESFELNGARKLLEKLQSDFLFSMTPCVRKKARTFDGREGEEDFPLERKYRKMAGEGMVRFLLESKDNVRRYLYEDCPLLYRMVKDEKGKVVRIDIKADIKTDTSSDLDTW